MMCPHETAAELRTDRLKFFTKRNLGIAEDSAGQENIVDVEFARYSQKRRYSVISNGSI